VKWLFVFILLFVFGTLQKSYSLTLSELRTQSRFFLRDTASSASRQKFSDTQLNTLLNNGQKEVNLRVWAVIATTVMALSAGTTEYSLPTSFTAPLRMTVDNTPIPERTLSFLDDSQSNWVQDSTGVPREYYIRTSSSFVTGVSRESVGFHPVSSGTFIASLEYLSAATDMSADSDIPFGSDNRRFYDFHHSLSYYTAFFGYMVLGMREDALFYFKLYENMMEQMEALSKTRLLYNPNFRGNVALRQNTQTGGQ